MKLGLIGQSLEHSFSQSYFRKKFEKLGLISWEYHNFELPDISQFPALLDAHPDLKGLNVTIPYKSAVIPYLDSLSAEAKEIGAVNTIRITPQELTGHNTDWAGFAETLEPLLQTHHQRCLVLGTGGAARAVCYALAQLGMTYLQVSRTPEAHQIDYAQATQLLKDHYVLINTTPAGTWPQTEEMPPVQPGNFSEKHLVYDLIYNPAETRLLREAAKRGAQTGNGLKMLELQAEKAWAIWNEL